jgi:hypothetical protein
MLKRFFLALSLVAGLLSPAFGSGSISLSLSQQFDSLGNPLNGGLLYFYASGTTTPQSAYQDSGLTIPWPNPITLDSAGRVPQLYFADGAIKIRLTNSAGVVQIAADNILVVGASSGSGGGGSVDATTVLATGDSGFVRANGRTIGSATSGATERANSDTQSLFEYLWTADANLSVSTGRGGSANADWVANKTIALPDWRGRGIAGLADMGNTATTVLTSTGCGSDPTILGGPCGFQTTTLNQSALPNVTLTVAIPQLTSNQINIGQGNLISPSPLGGGSAVKTFDTGAGTGAITTTPNSTSTASINGGTGQTAVPILPPMRLATVYLKL